MPSRLSFDRVASVYDVTRSLSPRPMARLLGVLVDELQGKRVLEVGVGTGRYAVPLQKSGVRVVGVDISHRMVDLGLSKGLRDVVFADGARLPFLAGSFDIATTNHVLHLIPDWRDVLREIGRVTRETYFTVIQRADGEESILREYGDLAREAGFSYQHPGIHERDLPNLVKPDIVMPVGPFRQAVEADALLDELDGRVYSFQWNAPEAVHSDVMAKLRAEWGGKYLERSFTLEVAFWRIDRLPELAKAPFQRS